jgi:hypothetical protein
LFVNAGLVVFDIPKFLNEYGIPVSESFVAEYFSKKEAKSAECFPDTDNVVMLLNEYSESIASYLMQNKGKLSFRAVPAGIQFGAVWKDEISRMTVEEGDGVASKKKPKGACQLSVQNKIFVFALNTANMESYFSGKIPNMEDYFNVIVERKREAPFNNIPAITNGESQKTSNNNNNIKNEPKNLPAPKSNQPEDIDSSSDSESGSESESSLKKQKVDHPKVAKKQPANDKKPPVKAKPASNNQK